jgi:hypothetical protein
LKIDLKNGEKTFATLSIPPRVANILGLIGVLFIGGNAFAIVGNYVRTPWIGLNLMFIIVVLIIWGAIHLLTKIIP